MTEKATLRVLVVDDNRILADSIAMIVETQGHTARTAYDGTEATAIAEELRPDACISDVVMPGMDGLELCLWLAEHHPECKLLLISGFSLHPATIDRLARHPRATTILPKPLLPTQIFQFLHTCVRVE